MNEEKRRFSPPSVGGSSLLVIFAVLCLIVFALLSISTVQADRRLADTSASAVVGWYDADTQAETVLARLRAGERPDFVDITGADVLTASYACRISDTQALRVRVELSGDSYRILQWQAVSTASWDPDQHIIVWDGGSGSAGEGN